MDCLIRERSSVTLAHVRDRAVALEPGPAGSGARLTAAHCDAVHRPVEPPPGLRRCRDLASVRDVVRSHLDACRTEQGDWRPALDGLRPVTAELWGRLSEPDRRAALTADLGWWNRHRHRMAPGVARDVAGCASTAG